MSASLRTIKRGTVAAQLLLICPAAVFMTSLLLRHAGALENEPAHTAVQIVSWYSGRMWTLWVLLIALPLSVLVVGCAALWRSWGEDEDLQRSTRHLGVAMRTQRATMAIAAASLTAGFILAVVVMHMLAN